MSAAPFKPATLQLCSRTAVEIAGRSPSAHAFGSSAPSATTRASNSARVLAAPSFRLEYLILASRAISIVGCGRLASNAPVVAFSETVAKADVVHSADHVIDCAVISGARRRRQEVGNVVDLDIELPLIHYVKLGTGIPVDRTGHVIDVDRRIVRRLKGCLRRAASRVALNVVVAEDTGVKPALYQREAAETVGIIFGIYNLPSRNRATLSIVGRAGAEITQRAGFIDAY